MKNIKFIEYQSSYINPAMNELHTLHDAHNTILTTEEP